MIDVSVISAGQRMGREIWSLRGDEKSG